MRGRRLLAAAMTSGLVLAGGVVAAATASAADQTCKATGSGTSWELDVTGASMPVGGYVAGFPGGTINTFAIDGFSGKPDTTGLPSGISNGIFTAIPSGRAVVIHVVTSGPPSGPFNVAFINQAQTDYGPLFGCPFDSGPAAGPGGSGNLGGGIFVASGDVNGDGSPDIFATVPSGGILLVSEVAPRAKHAALVKPARATAKKAGKVTIALQATAAGKAALAKKGTFTTTMKVTFKPTSGASSSTTAKVTFKKS